MSEEFQRIHGLCEQLRDILKTNQPLQLRAILNEISEITMHLSEEIHRIPIDTIDIFEYFLKYYLELLDMNEFVDIIVQHHSTLWISFNRLFFKSLKNIHQSNILSNMTLTAREQMYYRLFDQLNSSKSIKNFLENKIFSNENIEQTMMSFNGCILILIFQHLRALSTKSIGLELDKYQNTFFLRLIQFLDDYFTTNKRSQNAIIIEDILLLFLDISRKTRTIPMFIQINCPQVCLQWISLSYLSHQEYHSIIGILYNIVRHDNGIRILNYHKCHQILTEFREKILNKMIVFILNDEIFQYYEMMYFMTMILCYDTNELNNDSIRMFINHYLITAIRKARSIDECNDLECDISELWIVTMKLCTDDYFMNCIILNDKHINFLHLITRDFFVYTDDSTINYLPYRFIVLALANILWSISFHELYCKNLLKNFPDLFGRLELIRLDDTIDKVVLDDYIPRHMYSFKRVADGIYHNLRTFQSTKSSISISKSLSTKKSIHSLIISYAHDDIDFCQQLHDVLVKLPQLSVSVNFNNGKYLWEEIAQTIKQSHLVLFLVSQHFYHSLSCRQEFTYATNTLNKLFIPIIIDADYQAKGWLETRVKHIRFVEGNFSNNCDELFSMMSEYLSVDLPSISSLKNSTNIKQWDSADVQRWFINNGIKSELYEFYQFVNGNELFLYAKAILEFPWTKEYERIKLRFEEKFNEHDQHLSSYEFLKFINALEQLRNRYFILFKTN